MSSRFLVLIGVALCTSPIHAQLHVAVPIANLGEVRGGQKTVHRFELDNAGTTAVDILDIERGCGCVAARVERNRLEPAERTNLTVDLRTLGQAEGPHFWELTVKYRAGDDIKSLPLGLRGAVHNEITVQPAVLGLYVAKAVEQEIVLTGTRAAPLKVIHAEVQAAGVRVAEIERAGPKTKICLVAVGAKLGPGRQEGLLTITTDDLFYDQLRIPITVTKAASQAVRPAPEQAVLRVGAGAKTVSALVRLRSTTDAAVRIAKIEPSDPNLVCTWAAGPGNDATVKIRVNGEGVSQSWLGHVEVQLSVPAGETVTIPVVVQAPPQSR